MSIHIVIKLLQLLLPLGLFLLTYNFAVNYNMSVMMGKICICICIFYAYIGGLVARWLACWTQMQKGPGSNHSHNTVG